MSIRTNISQIVGGGEDSILLEYREVEVPVNLHTLDILNIPSDCNKIVIFCKSISPIHWEIDFDANKYFIYTGGVATIGTVTYPGGSTLTFNVTKIDTGIRLTGNRTDASTNVMLSQKAETAIIMMMKI